MVRVIPAIVSQHAEEASFLWQLRDLAVHAPHYRLKDLARLDSRVEAHLDGLRVNGEAAWGQIKEAAEGGDPGAIFAAGVLAIESGQEPRLSPIVEAAAATPKTARGLISALGWVPFERASPVVARLAGSEQLPLRRLGIAATAIHRQKPSMSLQRSLAGADQLLLARVFKAAGELGVQDMLPLLTRHLPSDEPFVAFWAAWAGTLLHNDRSCLAMLQSIAERGGRFAEDAAKLAVRRLGPGEVSRWHQKLASYPGAERAAIAAAGAAGNPGLVPWLIEQMNRPALARLAGEAISLISGVHIAYDKLEGSKPEGFESGPTEDPADENVELDLDEHLPWPDPSAVGKWWAARRGNFAKGNRYLLGRPITPDWLADVFRIGYQRQRAAAALELAVLQPGKPLFELRAPGFQQQRMLGSPG